MQSDWLQGVKTVGRFYTELSDGSVLITPEQQANLKSWGKGCAYEMGTKAARAVMGEISGFLGTSAIAGFVLHSTQTEAELVATKLSSWQRGIIVEPLITHAFCEGARHIIRTMRRQK
jgi:hypothetical protein